MKKIIYRGLYIIALTAFTHWFACGFIFRTWVVPLNELATIIMSFMVLYAVCCYSGWYVWKATESVHTLVVLGIFILAILGTSLAHEYVSIDPVAYKYTINALNGELQIIEARLNPIGVQFYLMRFFSNSFIISIGMMHGIRIHLMKIKHIIKMT